MRRAAAGASIAAAFVGLVWVIVAAITQHENPSNPNPSERATTMVNTDVPDDDYDLDLEEPVIEGTPPRSPEEFRQGAGEIDPNEPPVRLPGGPAITKTTLTMWQEDER